MRPALRESRPRTAVAASAVSLLAFFYLTVGTVGFLRFGAQTQGDCLQNFSPTDASAGIARVAVALTALSAFPMQHFPSRAALHRHLRGGSWRRAATAVELACGLRSIPVLPATQFPFKRQQNVAKWASEL